MSASYKMGICGASSCSLPNAKALSYILKHQAYGKSRLLLAQNLILNIELSSMDFCISSTSCVFFFVSQQDIEYIKNIRNRFLVLRTIDRQQTLVHMQATDFY